MVAQLLGADPGRKQGSDDRAGRCADDDVGCAGIEAVHFFQRTQSTHHPGSTKHAPAAKHYPALGLTFASHAASCLCRRLVTIRTEHG